MDPYETLRVARDADAETIKKAFRARARECHPDRAGDTPDMQERFNAVKQSYEILRDPTRRAFYDRYNCDGITLGLDEAGMQGALRTRGGMRIERGEKVPRAECTKCAGTGIRPSGRSCQACDPNLSPGRRGAASSMDATGGRGQRVRLRPETPPRGTQGRPMRNRTEDRSPPPPEASRPRFRTGPMEAPPSSPSSFDDLLGDHGGRVRLRPKKKKKR